MHDGANFGYYKKKNMATVLQRASGLVILFAMHFHGKAVDAFVSGQGFEGGKLILALTVETVFFGAVILHLALSFGNSFVSLGLIRSEKALRLINRTMYILCSLREWSY